MTQVLTVGHSTQGVQPFIGLLRQHSVSAVADVRSKPYSRFAPQFNREALKSKLAEENIGYAFLGEQLGARSRDRECYVDGRVQYALLAQTETFKHGLERLLHGAEAERIAVMCTEKDPLDCHRTLLVANALVQHGLQVAHIHTDGRLETNDDALDRLVRQHGLEQPDLFRSPTEIALEAMRRQEEQIAYVDESLVPTGLQKA